MKAVRLVARDASSFTALLGFLIGPQKFSRNSASLCTKPGPNLRTPFDSSQVCQDAAKQDIILLLGI